MTEICLFDCLSLRLVVDWLGAPFQRCGTGLPMEMGQGEKHLIHH